VRQTGIPLTVCSEHIRQGFNLVAFLVANVFPGSIRRIGRAPYYFGFGGYAEIEPVIIAVEI
jgi:hypothetical protein